MKLHSSETVLFSDEFLSELATQYMPPDESFHPTPMLSVALQKQRYFQELKETLKFTEMQEQIAHAVEMIFSHLKDLPKTQREEVQAELRRALNILIGVEEPIQVESQEQIVVSPGQQLGISEETILWIHKLVRQELEKEHFTYAEHLYSFLVLLCPYVYDFWFERGVACYYAHHYDLAIASYQAAIALSPEHPEIYFYLSLCLADHKHSNEAKEVLQEGKEAFKKQPTELKQWETLIQEIEKKINLSNR